MLKKEFVDLDYYKLDSQIISFHLAIHKNYYQDLIYKGQKCIFIKN
jgi:hypothetical protein